MNTKQEIALFLSFLLILGVTALYFYNMSEEAEESFLEDGSFIVRNITSENMITIKSGYSDIKINGEYYKSVTCECAKNTNTPCMAYCFEQTQTKEVEK